MEIPYIHGQLHDVIDYSKLIKLQASSTNDISKVVSYKKKFAKKRKDYEYFFC